MEYWIGILIEILNSWLVKVIFIYFIFKHKIQKRLKNRKITRHCYNV